MLIATANLNPSQAIVDHHCVVKPEDISRWLCEVPAKAILSTLRLKRLAASCSIVQNKKIWAKTQNMNKKYEQNMNKNMSKNKKYEQKLWTKNMKKYEQKYEQKQKIWTRNMNKNKSRSHRTRQTNCIWEPTRKTFSLLPIILANASSQENLYRMCFSRAQFAGLCLRLGLLVFIVSTFHGANVLWKAWSTY